MLAVFKRELRSYFTSMTGYVFIAAGTAFIGFYFMYVNMANGYPYFSYSLTQAFSAFALITPVITMKSFAEERKNKTDQLLLTYPVKISSIVLGKFFAMLLVFAIPFLISCACPLIIEITGDAHLLSDYVNIFIMILMGSAIVSIGMFVSSQTENQIIAAVVTLVVCLLIFWWDDVISYLPAEAPINAVMIFALIILASVILRNVSGDLFFSLCFGIIASIILAFLYFNTNMSFEGLVASLLSPLSLTAVVDNFAGYYVFDISGVFYLVSISVLFIFLTMQSLQKRRWS